MSDLSDDSTLSAIKQLENQEQDSIRQHISQSVLRSDSRIITGEGIEFYYRYGIDDFHRELIGLTQSELDKLSEKDQISLLSSVRLNLKHDDLYEQELPNRVSCYDVTIFESVTLSKALKEGCPSHLLRLAHASSRSIHKVCWERKVSDQSYVDEISWSVRPYLVSDSYDGTNKENAHLVCLELCNATDIDLIEVYGKTFPEKVNLFKSYSIPPFPEGEEHTYLDSLEYVRPYTAIPEPTVANITALLHSLDTMGEMALVDALASSWIAKGIISEYAREEEY